MIDIRAKKENGHLRRYRIHQPPRFQLQKNQTPQMRIAETHGTQSKKATNLPPSNLWLTANILMFWSGSIVLRGTGLVLVHTTIKSNARNGGHVRCAELRKGQNETRQKTLTFGTTSQTVKVPASTPNDTSNNRVAAQDSQSPLVHSTNPQND